ncbi:MAG: MBL fold metallo-hydrolase [Brucellaceae bacterium]|nr:MBL fold metallo-hydrolase [Brucellaceae bacterium]
MPTSSLLRLNGRSIVVDCGLGVARGLADQGIALQTLDLIFVSHLHSDHYLELGPLLHTAWTAGLKTPVTVCGPEGLERYWQHFIESMRFDIDLRIADEGRPDLRALVSFRALAEGTVYADETLSVEALRNDHPPIEESYALSFEGGGKHVVFSGDTAYLPALADFARGADLLVHEAMLGEAVDALVARVGNGDERLKIHLHRSHTLAEDAGRIAAKAGVKALALHHLVPSDDPAFGPDDWTKAVRTSWGGPLHIGSDGLRIPV